MSPPLILLTNDDGVQARGLAVLREALSPLGEVVVVAPTHEQSASSHSVTIDRPLRHIEHAPRVHSIDGTPADCVYLALFEPRFLPRPPSLVVSGINHGLNVGTSVFYSGTIAGAREAAMRGIPAVALSHDGDVDGDWIGPLTTVLIERVLTAEQPTDGPVLLNVNLPRERPTELRVTRVGRQIYQEEVIPRRDPGGREYFWIGGVVTDDDVEGSDAKAVAEGVGSITPLELEVTNASHLGLAAFVAGPEASDGV